LTGERATHSRAQYRHAALGRLAGKSTVVVKKNAQEGEMFKSGFEFGGGDGDTDADPRQSRASTARDDVSHYEPPAAARMRRRSTIGSLSSQIATRPATSAPPFAFSLMAPRVVVPFRAERVPIVIRRVGPLAANVALDVTGVPSAAGLSQGQVSVSSRIQPKWLHAVVGVPLRPAATPAPDVLSACVGREFSVTVAAAAGGAQKQVAAVEVGEDKNAGSLEFGEEEVRLQPQKQDTTLPLLVRRYGGTRGKVSVCYRTVADSAEDGVDFVPTAGRVELDDGQSYAVIVINLQAGGGNRDDRERTFTVELFAPNCEGSDGDSELLGPNSVCRIVLEADEDLADFIAAVESRVHELEQSSVLVEWAGQFKDAVTFDAADASFMDGFLHTVTMPWRIAFAFVPPPALLAGWGTFVCSLLLIGVLTAVVGEVASMFGCVLGVPDAITAITFVAMGTSLPDTFASKQAAVEDENADAAIGNVTGSNSVNVYLGLGLPWTIASIYYSARGEIYCVPSGNLVSSVTLFGVLATIALGLLVLRRMVPACGGGEIGGPARWLFALPLSAFWLVYLLVTSLVALGHLPSL